MITAVLVAAATGLVALVAYMLLQRPPTSPQTLLAQARYAEAREAATANLKAAPRDTAAWSDRAEASKLLGELEDALRCYEQILKITPHDPAAIEGVAMTLTYLGRDPARAQQTIEQAIQLAPAIQEFQALAHAFVLLRQGKRGQALQIFEDNRELLETRFEMDYTDPDPLLAETLFWYAELARASGDEETSSRLRSKVAAWAPGSLFATSPP